MAIRTRVCPGQYRDSVALMQFSTRLGDRPGVQQASAVMATENNLDLLREAGLGVGAVEAGPNDLLLVLQGEDEEALEELLDQAVEELERPAEQREQATQAEPPHSVTMGVSELPAANLVLISTPGEYAAAEALKALRLGRHVMIFSDNVTLEDEIALKQYAREHDLLVMGPDCGTAIINGIPLAFANVVRRGDIGLIGASGTGLQQVSSLIDRLGAGVSQAIGVGSHDLSREVAGTAMIQSLRALAEDPATRVIVLISKPPAREVLEPVLAVARESGKPVVVDFIGADPEQFRAGNLHGVRTLADAALAAVALSRGEPLPAAPAAPAVERELPAWQPAPTQQYVRGLFSGGTFCFEANLLLQEALGPVYSNVTKDPAQHLPDPWHSVGHTVIDLGDDLFTQGRPHPMIDYRLRNQRILQEAQDSETAVILLDVVLGYGSHPDPASELAPVVREARETAAAQGRDLVVVGFVCGTEGDPQGLARQEEALRQAGMLLADANAEAARLAAAVATSVRKERSHV